MIPNLTVIIAVYVTVRLITVALRQFPTVERMLGFRIAMTALSMLAIIVTVSLTAETIMSGEQVSPKGRRSMQAPMPPPF
jgi:hypothetical protein